MSNVSEAITKMAKEHGWEKMFLPKTDVKNEEVEILINPTVRIRRFRSDLPRDGGFRHVRIC